MKHIDLSIWPSHSMPVVIDGLVGYATDTVPVRGGTRTYIWIKVWKLGLEITVARAAPN
jgi:hypothetical protein